MSPTMLRPRAGARRIAISALALGALGACAPRPDPAPPVAPRLVLLFATCSVNRSFLSPYALDVRYTPRLAHFAREAVVFRRHETEFAFSGPAFATLFTGTFGDRHGVDFHPRRLADDAYLITEAFVDAGWIVHFWDGHVMASQKLNYAQGVPPERVHAASPADRRTLSAADPTFRALLDGLRSHSEQRAFVLAAFTQTHYPYADGADHGNAETFCQLFPDDCRGLPPAAFERQFERFRARHASFRADFDQTAAALGLGLEERSELVRAVELAYKSSVYQLDRSFGRTLDALADFGLLDQSVIAFTADHGESLFREGRRLNWLHGPLWSEGIEVPWLLAVPGLREPSSYPALTRSVDVFPTLAALAGLRLPAGARLDGVDLSAAALGAAPAPRLRSYSRVGAPALDTLRHRFPELGRLPFADSGWARLRDGDLVLRLDVDPDAPPRAFDLARDPDEAVDRYDPSSARHRELARDLSAYLDRARARGRSADPSLSLTESEMLGALRQLGYLR